MKERKLGWNIYRDVIGKRSEASFILSTDRKT
jgi:hypothetical protein